MEPRERFEAYFDGEMTPEEVKEFCAALRGDAERMREFVRHAHLHRGLREELKGRGVRRVELSAELAAEVAPRRNWGRWAVAAALLLIGIYGVYRFAMPDPALAMFAARVEKVSGPVFVMDKYGAMRVPAVAGNYLQRKTGLEFDGAGAATLKYLDGSALTFTALSNQSWLRISRSKDKPEIDPATEGKRITIENGNLDADVAKQPPGEPLIISTTLAEVTVIGTQFKLYATADSTRLEVREGKVRIARYADRASVDVSAGEVVVVKGSGELVVKKL